MNIFFLDEDPVLAAEYHCDKHVVKMIVETAQLLSTACWHLGDWSDDLYRPTHDNHPCALWVRSSRGNYVWTLDLLDALLEEFNYRYPRKGGHATARLIPALRRRIASDAVRWPSEDLTPPAQAMPEQYRGPDPASAYRRYYLAEKRDLLTYTRRTAPDWVEKGIQQWN